MSRNPNTSQLAFVTPSARELYRLRYPALPPERFVLNENGYDEESFAAAGTKLDRRPLVAGCITLLHSGIVCPSERDPSASFETLGKVRRGGTIDASILRMRFRAPVHTDQFRQRAAESQVQDLIAILPPVPYREAVQEMLRADSLVVVQCPNCNEQIPAKLYEYFRARRPIFGLADPLGNTGKVMRESGVAQIARLDDALDVQAAIADCLGAMRGNMPFVPSLGDMSRRARVGALAGLFDDVLASPDASR